MQSAIHDLHIEPSPGASGTDWRDLALKQPTGELFGHAQSTWHEKTRCELGLATDRPIIATGHQTLLWHPGILAKYLIVDRIAQQQEFATANLIVNQHVGPYGRFDVPIRRSDGSLHERTIDLVPDGDDPARRDVPMGLQSAFAPSRPPKHLPFALDSVRDGVERIFDRVAAHRDAPNAAHQMARALGDLMDRWVRPMPPVTASDLGDTSLARRIMQAMVDDPRAMAEAYNAAVRAVPEAGIPTLLVHDLYVEVPLWRIRNDGRRMRAYDNDLDRDDESITLLPRALFMTALVRLGMCDLYVHGTGGGTYDRAMELWIRNWLGVDVAPVGITTATLHLPLGATEAIDLAQAMHAYRHTWHDPARNAQSFGGMNALSKIKRQYLKHINQVPRRSPERKAAFFHMHEELDRLRHSYQDRMNQSWQHYDAARRRRADSRIVNRRDWPFPLYPVVMIDELAEAVNAQLRSPVAVR